jgi:hypothetical protein
MIVFVGLVSYRVQEPPPHHTFGTPGGIEYVGRIHSLPLCSW